MVSIYSEKVIKHFKNPRNLGKLKDPDGIGKVGNLTCGDVMWLYIKVGKNKKDQDVIKDISFETFGCVAALATSSVITDLAKGKTLENALKISKNKVVESLGGLPPIKLHCSVLAADALGEAIYDYLSKNKKPVPKELKIRHEQALKDRETISHRYKDWTDFEQELHEK